MKLNISKIVIFSLFATTIFSCTNVEEDLFDEPASTRLEKSRQHYQEVLESSKEDWLLQYFPDPSQKYGGFNYYLNFQDGNVTAKLEGEKDRVTSAYAVKSRGGTIISFDAYNELLHRFANPSGRSPEGMEGDFEFLVLNQKGDTINLKGLKTGNYLRIFKLKGTAEEYETKLNSVKKYIGKLNYPLQGTVNNTEAVVKYEGEKRFSLVYGETKTGILSFIYTDRGISFYKPLKVGDKEYKDLIFNKEENRLYSEDGVIDIKLSYILVNFNLTSWTLDIAEEANRSEKMKTAWDGDNLLNAITLGKKFDLNTYYTIGNEGGKVGIFSYLTQVETGNVLGVGGLGLGFKVDENDDTVIHITKGKPYALDWYYSRISNVNDMITQNSPYKIELNDDSTEVKLTSTTDSDVWFVLQKK